MNDKTNRLYDFFKRNILSYKTVILLLCIMICSLLFYIAGMNFSIKITDTTESQVTESITSESDISEKESTTEYLRININSDDIYELCDLPDIGEAKAKAIIEYRKENGNFTSPDELLNVHGIGEKIYENIKNYIFIAE